jgi:asparagine synthase (glutamine-hydrolysing)
MCGIVGFNWDDKELIKNMAYAIRHRGPDQESYFTDKSISLGHKRLSIIDLSEKGKQPMFNEDGSICIVFNGEIYNFQEIKPELEKKGHKFNSDSDTEVIIHAYEEYGYDCLKLFNGMFAFAIWDSNKKELFMARDRLGQKFLYYYYKDNKLLFASEIKALLQYEGIKKEFNTSTLSQFITWAYAIDGSTFFKNINELNPGHYMIYNGNSIKINKYWDLEDSLRIRSESKNESYYIKKLRNLLVKSVERRLISDVPLGASLSGGLDSSMIVGIMSHLRGENIKTYTIGFGRADDEFPYARAVAEHCNAEYNEIILSYDDMTKSMPQVLWSLEIPWARPAQPAIYHLLKELKKHVTVNLVGEGADEFFAGYNRYQPYAPIPNYSKVYEESEFNKKWWDNFKKYENMSIKEKIDLITSGYFNDINDKKANFTDEILNELPPNCTAENTFGKLLKHPDNAHHLNTALCFECKTSLPGVQLVKLDKLSMASSLEVRAPFLDHNVAEFSMQIPPIMKWNGLDKKYIIQKIAAEFIPKKNAFRRKLPLQVPLADYYKNDFLDVIKSMLSEKSIAKRDYLKKGHITKLLSKFKENPNFTCSKTTSPTKDNSLRQLLFLTNLELMQRMFFENDNLRNPSMDINKYI